MPRLRLALKSQLRSVQLDVFLRFYLFKSVFAFFAPYFVDSDHSIGDERLVPDALTQALAYVNLRARRGGRQPLELTTSFFCGPSLNDRPSGLWPLLHEAPNSSVPHKPPIIYTPSWPFIFGLYIYRGGEAFQPPC